MTDFEKRFEEFMDSMPASVGETPRKLLKDFILAEKQLSIQEAVGKISKRLKHRLSYCLRQNGIHECKNCGLCKEDFKLTQLKDKEK